MNLNATFKSIEFASFLFFLDLRFAIKNAYRHYFLLLEAALNRILFIILYIKTHN